MSPFPSFQPSSSPASVAKNQLQSAFSSESAPSRKSNDFVSPHSSQPREFHHLLSKADKPSAKPASATEKKKRKAASEQPHHDAPSAIDSSAVQASVTSTIPLNDSSTAEASTDDPSLKLKGASGKSVAQLLADGVQVLEFGEPSGKLGSQPSGGTPRENAAVALDAAPALTAEIPAGQTAPGETKASHDGAAAAMISDGPAKLAGSPNSLIDPQTPQEKIAALAQKQATGGDNPSFAQGKNQALPDDYKLVEHAVPAVGTPAANRVKAMPPAARILPTSSSTGAFAHVVASRGSDAATTLSTSPTPAVDGSRAADLVHQIHEIADGLWAVDRNSVEVKFNFSELEKLSVRVEYRNGSVQATFRTDSPTLRDAIAHQWQSQQPGEQRPYRVADPVFTGSSLSSESFAGGDSSRQQRPDAQSVPFERLSSFASSRSAPATTAVSLAASSFRPDTAGHLHALV